MARGAGYNRAMQRPLTLTQCLLLGVLVAACDKGGKDDVITVQSPVRINEQKLQARVDSAKAELEKKRAQFAAESQKHLDALDEKLSELKTRASSSTEEVSDELLATLKRQRDEARSALESAQSASADKWESVKGKAREALDKAEHSYDEALQKLKRD